MEAIAFEAKENLVKVYFVMELMSIDLRKLIFYEIYEHMVRVV